VTAVGAFDHDAIALLQSLSGPHGIQASLSPTTNYRAVFARDAVMAGIAGLMLEDPLVSAALVRTLEHLRSLQGAEGQIASNYEILGDRPPNVSFGTLAPRIDAATWYLIGIALGARAKVLDPAPFRDSARAVVRLLDALEYNGRHLIYIPPGGNWADEYVSEGYILYDQVLRAWALRLLGATYDEAAWTAKSTAIGQTIGERYQPPDDAERHFPIASFSPLGTRDTFDLAACALLALSGIAPELGARGLDEIASSFLVRDRMPPAFHPVIQPGDPEWPALRRYHLHEFRNHPHEYHNGGIWPIWIGWLALALAAGGRQGDLDQLRSLIAASLEKSGVFAFDEFLHGQSGVLGGTPLMAYSATGIVFLRLAGSPAQTRLLT